MNPQSLQSMQVVKRDEKEAKMTQFILGEIASGRVSINGQWSVIALSLQSPVVAAMQRVVNDLGSASELQIQIMVGDRTKHLDGAGFEGIESLTVRSSTSSRLLDAHEQLVLGDLSSWTGDCMRRDPRERDAFETYGGDDRQLAKWATRGFERIWATARPLNVRLERSGAYSGASAFDGALANDFSKIRAGFSATSRN
jgi:hypothetical protein